MANPPETRDKFPEITIDRTSGVPLYLQIKDRILYEISVAGLTPGTVLPSIRNLANQLNVATATVRHAYASLETEGFVVPRQGKGMLVGELDVLPAASPPLFRDEVVRLFVTAIARANAVGAPASEIRDAFIQAFSQWAGRPSVIFVGAERGFLEHYRPFLMNALKPLRVSVSVMLLRDLESQHLREITWLTPPLCLVTLVRSYSRVRESVGDSRIPIIAMALSLSEETKRRLMNIGHDSRVTLVAEPSNIAGFQHLVEQYATLDEPLVCRTPEADDLADVLDQTDVVIYSLRVSDMLTGVHVDPQMSIEIDFDPEPISMRRISEVVESQLGLETDSDQLRATICRIASSVTLAGS